MAPVFKGHTMRKDLTLKEIKKLKKVAEDKFVKILTDFHIETGLIVENIDFKYQIMKTIGSGEEFMIIDEAKIAVKIP